MASTLLANSIPTITAEEATTKTENTSSSWKIYAVATAALAGLGYYLYNKFISYPSAPVKIEPAEKFVDVFINVLLSDMLSEEPRKVLNGITYTFENFTTLIKDNNLGFDEDNSQISKIIFLNEEKNITPKVTAEEGNNKILSDNFKNAVFCKNRRARNKRIV